MCLFRKQIEAAEDHRWVWLARIAVETEDEWWWHKSKANATLGDDVDEAMRHRISFWFGYFASVSLVFLISLSLFHPLDHFHLLVCFDGKTSTHSLYYTDIYGLKDPLCMCIWNGNNNEERTGSQWLAGWSLHGVQGGHLQLSMSKHLSFFFFSSFAHLSRFVFHRVYRKHLILLLFASFESRFFNLW